MSCVVPLVGRDYNAWTAGQWGSSMTEQKPVGFFSKIRWGGGQTIVVVIASCFAALLAYQGFRTGHDSLLIASAAVTFGVAAVAFVTAVEQVKLDPLAQKGLLGSHGTVVNPPSPGRAGVIRVGSELWSAYSELPLVSGQVVVVIKIEGAYVWVRPVSEKHPR